MSLPYRWYPDGTVSKRRPDVGDLIPHEHAVWRIVEVRDIPEADRDRYRDCPFVLTLRPATITGDDPRARDHDIHIGRPKWRSWDVYPDEHYPICACCHEPVPCRAEMAKREAERMGERLNRFSQAGVCAYCGEVIRPRQKSVTFAGDNLELPGGPPVSFHLRGKPHCINGAIQYEKRWVAADPDNRPWRLYCPGSVVNHNDGTYECSRGAACPGPHVRHDSYRACADEECHANGGFGCTPAASAVLREEAL